MRRSCSAVFSFPCRVQRSVVADKLVSFWRNGRSAVTADATIRLLQSYSGMGTQSCAAHPLTPARSGSWTTRHRASRPVAHARGLLVRQTVCFWRRLDYQLTNATAGRTTRRIPSIRIQGLGPIRTFCACTPLGSCCPHLRYRCIDISRRGIPGLPTVDGRKTRTQFQGPLNWPSTPARTTARCPGVGLLRVLRQ